MGHKSNPPAGWVGWGGGIPLIELSDPNSEAIFGLQVISVPTNIFDRQFIRSSLKRLFGSAIRALFTLNSCLTWSSWLLRNISMVSRFLEKIK